MRFKLLAGSYIQAKYPGVRRKARVMPGVPEDRRNLESLFLDELKELASNVCCPVEDHDDEHSLRTRLVSSSVYRARDPNNNIIESDIDLEKFGRNKFQCIDRLLEGDPVNHALLARIAGLERENAELRGGNAGIESSELHEGSNSKSFPNFRRMTVKQLRDYAEQEVGLESIDDTWSKDQLVQAIESAVASV